MDLIEYKKKLERKTCSAKELSEMLEVSEAKARRLMRIEGFPVITIGRNKRVILSQIDVWLEKNIGEVFQC